MVRLFTIAFAAAAFGWFTFVLPVFLSEATVAHAAIHIAAGEVYEPEAMEALDKTLAHHRGTGFRSSILNKVAIIRLRSAEDA
ncbi:hypothetical protein, partial [Staphylococcus aureus]